MNTIKNEHGQNYINFFLTPRTFLGSAIRILDYAIYKISLYSCHGENYTLAAEMSCVPEVWGEGGRRAVFLDSDLEQSIRFCPRQICPVKS